MNNFGGKYIPKDWFYPVAILLIAIVTRLYGINQWPIEGDEIFTYSYAKGTSEDYFFSATYFITSYLFKIFGDSETTVRITSVFFGILPYRPQSIMEYNGHWKEDWM